MSIALDFGACRLKSIRLRDARLLGRNCRSVYSTLSDTETVRKMLQRMELPFAECDGCLVLMGAAAAEVAELVQSPGIPLFPQGRLPHNDPPVRQIIAALVETLLPTPFEPGEICGMTLPGAAAVSGASNNRELDFLTHLVELRGYRPLIVNSGLAVVLAEMGAESFTGIGMSIGAVSTDVSLTHQGVEVARCSIPRAGNWIDAQLAAAEEKRTSDIRKPAGHDTAAISRWKETWTGSIHAPIDDREELLVELYRQLLAHVLQETAAVFGEQPQVYRVPRPVNLVCTGGSARLPGIDHLLRQAIELADFPVQIGSIRIAADCDYTVARGCLINAELETTAIEHCPAA